MGFIEELLIMVKTLTRHGNSMALVIEKPILELLGAGPETLFDITTDGKVLILKPIQNEDLNRKVMEALEKVNKKYEKALKKLAE